MENKETKQREGNLLEKAKKFLVNSNETDFSAEKAWIETSYGKGSYHPLERRIEEKQKYIRASIESKFGYIGQASNVRFSSYHCIIDIEDDLKNHIDEVFKPFKDNGFKIINISERIEEIHDEYVYLISWRNAFSTDGK